MRRWTAPLFPLFSSPPQRACARPTGAPAADRVVSSTPLRSPAPASVRVVSSTAPQSVFSIASLARGRVRRRFGRAVPILYAVFAPISRLFPLLPTLRPFPLPVRFFSSPRLCDGSADSSASSCPRPTSSCPPEPVPSALVCSTHLAPLVPSLPPSLLLLPFRALPPAARRVCRSNTSTSRRLLSGACQRPRRRALAPFSVCSPVRATAPLLTRGALRWRRGQRQSAIQSRVDRTDGSGRSLYTSRGTRTAPLPSPPRALCSRPCFAPSSQPPSPFGCPPACFRPFRRPLSSRSLRDPFRPASRFAPRYTARWRRGRRVRSHLDDGTAWCKEAVPWASRRPCPARRHCRAARKTPKK